MEVYIVEIDNDLDYDDFSHDSFIIAAENEIEAEKIASEIASKNYVNPVNVSTTKLTRTDNGVEIKITVI